MKKFLYLLLWLLTLLVIVIVVRTLLFKSQQVVTEETAIPSFGMECLEHLSEAVRFPTVSYSPDSPVDTSAFKDYINFVEATFPKVQNSLEREVFNNFSLLYKWGGTNASLKPMVLMAHYDVVPPGDTASWQNGPFSGLNDGSFIWGRGTLDDKAAMISILEAVERLLTEGFKPERTIFLAFGHDEELLGERGAKSIALAMKDRGINPEFVLDEGMAVTSGMVPMIKQPVALIGTSEKGYLSLSLSADFAGGHSSTPEKESALTIIAKAINDLVENPMEPKISGPVNDFIKYIGPEMPFYAKAIFANKWIFKGLIINIYEGSASGNALVRTTTAPTIFNSGFKDNAIPKKAEAVVNFRILPGETTEDVIAHVKKTIGDDRVTVTIYDDAADDPAPVSPAATKGFGFIHASIRQVYPDAIVAPTMMLGASDSRHFTLVTNNIYRFAPIKVGAEDMARIHGLNERTVPDDYINGIRFFYMLIRNSQKE